MEQMIYMIQYEQYIYTKSEGAGSIPRVIQLDLIAETDTVKNQTLYHIILIQDQIGYLRRPGSPFLNQLWVLFACHYLHMYAPGECLLQVDPH